MTLRREGEALVVDRATWAALAGAEQVDPQLTAAAAAVPGGEQALEAGRDPLVVVQVQTATPGGVFTHEAWVDEDAAAVLLDLGRGEDRRLLVLPPDHLAASLARMVRLAPRAHAPADREARAVQESELEAWFGAASPGGDAPTGRAGAALGADRAWRLVAAAVGSDAAPLMLAAVDGRDSGLWVVDVGEDVDGDDAATPGSAEATAAGGLRLVPTTPTQVWRELAGVLPALVPPEEAVTTKGAKDTLGGSPPRVDGS
ncbi:hypothetical protein [Serinicoccus sp. LYQ131]|uniref:hypothetical protein n=1 Tax=Serinicoccus sp. LYQ131 TaxID=3378797 RepID=UPI0038520036